MVDKKVQYNYAKLRGRMAEKGENIESLSRKIGIVSQTLRQRLKGRRYFTQDEIANICVILDIDVDEIPFFFFTP